MTSNIIKILLISSSLTFCMNCQESVKKTISIAIEGNIDLLDYKPEIHWQDKIEMGTNQIPHTYEHTIEYIDDDNFTYDVSVSFKDQSGIEIYLITRTFNKDTTQVSIYCGKTSWFNNITCY